MRKMYLLLCFKDTGLNPGFRSTAKKLTWIREKGAEVFTLFS